MLAIFSSISSKVKAFIAKKKAEEAARIAHNRAELDAEYSKLLERARAELDALPKKS